MEIDEMEIDEMKAAWRELDRRMDAGVERDQRIWKELKLDRTRSALRRLAGGPVVECAIDALAVLLLGVLLVEHIQAVRFAVPILALHIAAIVKLSATVRQLVLIAGIDYAAPVVEIQRRLAALRALRIRITRWALLLAPLLWTPMVIAAAYVLVGVDLYRGFGLLWVGLNLAFGLAVIALALWIARRHAGWLGRSRLLQRLADDIAGRSLLAAAGHLDQIARFEDER